MDDIRKRPTRAELLAAAGKTVPDVIAPGLNILFVGINPGLYTAAIGHHFGRPGNRFWTTLHRVGFTPRLLSPYEEQELLAYGYGITNLVARATAAADELMPDELLAGGKVLAEKVQRFAPRCVAVLGVTAYRQAFQRPKAGMGRQEERLGDALLWVLPNPSGLNAHYQSEGLALVYGELKQDVEKSIGA